MGVGASHCVPLRKYLRCYITDRMCRRRCSSLQSAAHDLEIETDHQQASGVALWFRQGLGAGAERIIEDDERRRHSLQSAAHDLEINTDQQQAYRGGVVT
jgi:hypothetical protein